MFRFLAQSARRQGVTMTGHSLVPPRGRHVLVIYEVRGADEATRRRVAEMIGTADTREHWTAHIPDVSVVIYPLPLRGEAAS